MKKLLILPILLIFLLSGCDIETNRNVMLTGNYYYDRAIISLPNGLVVSGKVEQWDMCDNLFIITIDGQTYCVHMSNAVLIDTEN